MITPSEARKLHEIDKDEAKRWEAKIDTALKAFDGQTISIDCRGISTKLRDYLKAAYEKAGWRVKVNSGDQRDPGPWFEFND